MHLQSQRRSVAEYFESNHARWNDLYDGRVSDGYLFRTRLETAIALCRRHVGSPGRALDLGCGCGPGSVRLAEMGHQVIGLDLSRSMVDQAARNARRANVAARCEFVCGDFSSVGLEPRSFDVIVALGFIEYFDAPTGVLGRMRDLLAHGGRIVVQTPNRWQVRHLLRGRLGDPIERNWAGLNTRRFSSIEVKRLARDAGLRRIDYRGHAFGPLKIAGRFIPGYRAARWLEHRMDDVAQHRLTRALGNVGSCLIHVLEKSD